MARSDYGPEIRQSIASPTPRKSVPQRKPGGVSAKAATKADTPAEVAGDKAQGIKQNSPQDMAMDAKMGGGGMPMMAQGGGHSNSPAHSAMAASIAHAILQKGG